MKKRYTKPALVCQELRPETLLCGCAHTNPTFNEVQQCGYFAEDLGFVIFSQSWAACEWSDPSNQYCYQVSAGGVFGS